MTDRRRESVVVIGNFDGVHRGHAALIRTARASEPDARLVAVTFWPHPMSVVRPDQTPPLLTTLERRTELLKQVGVDEVVVVEFTPEVASWSPAEFVDSVLRPLRPRRIVVGENFRFGFRASGDVRTLAELGQGSYEVQALPLVTDGTQPSSSTAIRHAVADGDFGRVRELSDHPFRFTGVVVRGDQRGHELGFPTANVPVSAGMAVPADGVYAGWVTRLDLAGRAALAGRHLRRHQPDLRRRAAPRRGVRAGPRRPRALRGGDRHRVLRPAARAGEVRRPRGPDRPDARRRRAHPARAAHGLSAESVTPARSRASVIVISGA